MSNLIEALIQRKAKGYVNYIEQIRFPYFKKITENTVITFDYPFTVLVGPNGSGKTSVLQALYGSPRGKSVREFWFSTPIDPNNDTAAKTSRFIYKYKPSGSRKTVEVIKKRVHTKKTKTQKENPDYWEPARPSSVDNMELMPPNYDEKKDTHRSATRWNTINKKVEYIDFKGELSSFDKFFYFGDYTKTVNIDSKQDFLRHRSNVLKNLLSGTKFPNYWHSRKVKSINFLNEEQLNWTNKILGKNYSSALIIEHDLFNNDGFSILFTENDHSYSEAVAGSGEMSVVKCVLRVLASEKDSLILLDEPEVSLHPGAQTQLRDMLLTKVIKDGCQVVLSTHSQSFIEKLPNEAIKVFYRNEVTNTYSIINSSAPEQAFLRIGMNISDKRAIYVEDILAEFMVKEAIKEIDHAMLNNVSVIPYPGGAEAIIKNLALSLSFQPHSKDFILLDGDKTPKSEKKISSQISEQNRLKIDEILKEQTGISGDNFTLPLSGGNAAKKVKDNQALKMKLDILDTFHSKFNFMNVNTPEELLWEISKDADAIKFFATDASNSNYKDFFRTVCCNMKTGDNSSESIFRTQIMAFNHKNNQHTLWVNFVNQIKALLQVEHLEDALSKTA